MNDPVSHAEARMNDPVSHAEARVQRTERVEAVAKLVAIFATLALVALLSLGMLKLISTVGDVRDVQHQQTCFAHLEGRFYAAVGNAFAAPPAPNVQRSAAVEEMFAAARQFQNLDKVCPG